MRNQFIAGKLPLIYLQLAEFSYINSAKSKPDFGYFNFPPSPTEKAIPGFSPSPPRVS